MRPYYIFIGFFLLGLIQTGTVPTGARASIVIGLSTPEMSADADAIVVGTIGKQEAIRTDSGLIVTQSEVIVDDQIKNTSQQQVRSIVTLGGQIGDLGMSVPGAPQFTSGERVILFLNDRGNRNFHVVGLAQGAFSIRHVKGVDMVEQKVSNLILLGPPNAAIQQSKSLQNFLGEIRNIVANQKRANNP